MFSGKVYKNVYGEEFMYHNSVSMNGKVWKSPYENNRFNPTNSQLMTYKEFVKETRLMDFIRDQSFNYQYPNFGQ